MATIDNSVDSFLAASSSGVGANLRVKLTANKTVEPAGASDTEIGVTDFKVNDEKTPVKVRLTNGGGSVEVIAGGAITAGSIVKRAANGKVTADGAGSNYGIAYGSATADGDYVVVYPL